MSNLYRPWPVGGLWGRLYLSNAPGNGVTRIRWQEDGRRVILIGTTTNPSKEYDGVSVAAALGATGGVPSIGVKARRPCRLSGSVLISRCVQHNRHGQRIVAVGVGDGEVAAGFGPFVMLLGQHRAHQPPRRQPVGEDAHHVSPAPYLPVQPFLWVLDHSFCQWATGKAVKARMSGAASASSSATWGKGSRSCSTTRSS